jgi:transposase InsO family protein
VSDAYRFIAAEKANHPISLMSRLLGVDALQMALARRQPEAGLIHHSDQGS